MLQYAYMIGYLEGVVLTQEEKSCILLVQGVGYKVFPSPNALASLVVGKEAALWIYTVVREDAFELFGFTSKDEQSFFEELISVSGVGPRGALGIIGLGSVRDLRTAIANNDVHYLTKVSGIGKKTAEKIVVELKDKLSAQADVSFANQSSHSELIDALQSLGYSLSDIRPLLNQVGEGETGDKLKTALKLLAK